MSDIGIGLIGTGYMGKCHALAWNAVKPVFGEPVTPRLVHLAEADPDLAKTRADEFGFARATADWRELVADPDVAVVSITAPNSFHPEMAIAALEAGKHVWCEKPMAPAFADAERMLAAANKAGTVAALGYNYIQNPAIRHIAQLIADNTIGPLTHVRIEMDEDFMADPAAPFSLKSEAASGYGAIDDFGVHLLSLVTTLAGPIEAVMADMAKPYPDRATAGGSRRDVETHDIANVLMRLANGASGVAMANRAARGRKGRIFIQIFGADGAIVFDQERMNEFGLYLSADPAGEQGFRTILTGPQHPPYDRFIPAPGHGLGFNDLKIIEAHELLAAISGENAHLIDFDTGIGIERAVHAMARSHAEERWVRIGA